MKLLTLKEIKEEYKTYPYIQEQNDVSNLIDWFQRQRDSLNSDINSYEKVCENGVITNYNSDIHIAGIYHKQAKDRIYTGNTTVAKTICDLTNEAVKKSIESEIIPELEKQIIHVEFIIISLMSIHVKAY